MDIKQLESALHNQDNVGRIIAKVEGRENVILPETREQVHEGKERAKDATAGAA